MGKDLQYFLNEYGAIIKGHFKELFESTSLYLKKKWITIIYTIVLGIVLFKIDPLIEQLYPFETFDEKFAQKVYNNFNGHVIAIGAIVYIIFIFLQPILNDSINQITNQMEITLKKIINFSLLAYLWVPLLILTIVQVLLPFVYYSNTLYHKEDSLETLKVLKVSKDRIKLNHQTYGSTNYNFDIKKIERLRVLNNQTSLYCLYEGDTIMVKFKKGFIDELYLK